MACRFGDYRVAVGQLGRKHLRQLIGIGHGLLFEVFRRVRRLFSQQLTLRVHQRHPFCDELLRIGGKIDRLLADFRAGGDTQVDAHITDLRLLGIAFDAKTLRVIAEADGNANVAVNALTR